MVKLNRIRLIEEAEIGIGNVGTKDISTQITIEIISLSTILIEIYP
jgi:hypothetical protein